MSCFLHSLNAVAASKQTHTHLRRTPKSSRRSKLTSFCLLHCIQRVILTQDRCWITSICGLFFLQRKKKHQKISHIWHVFCDLNITGNTCVPYIHEILDKRWWLWIIREMWKATPCYQLRWQTDTEHFVSKQ